MHRSIPHGILTIFVLVCFFCLVWPGYAWWGNSIEPRILGIPFSFAWNILWVVLSFVALLLFHASTRGRGKR